MEMNSMYRNFDNQFYRNSGSFMSVYPMEMNSMYLTSITISIVSPEAICPAMVNISDCFFFF